MSNEPKRFGCLGVFIAALLCLSLLFNALFFIGSVFGVAAGEFGGTFRETMLTKPAPEVKTKIAVIRVDGLIGNSVGGLVGETMVDDIKLELKQALDDKEVRAIVLAIDSPGGEVTASDVIYNAVKKAKMIKPIVVSMGSMAASGGYYIAVGGSHIIAHDTTFTGSIGVIMQSINYAELMGKVGVQTLTFKSGKMKDMLSGSRPPTQEERDYVQSLVMQTYSKFVGIVSAERNLPEAQLRAGLADGRVISGQDAFAAKLVDEIGDFDTAVAKAMQLGLAPGSAVVKYEAGGGIARYLRMLGKADASRKVEINVGPQQALKLEPGRLYLLPEILVP